MNPILFGSDKDRTGAAGLVRKADAVIGLRFASLKRDVIAAFDRIPTYAVNADILTAYGFTELQMRGLSEDLQAAVDRWLLAGDGSYAFWYDRYSVESSLIGTTQAVTNLTAISEVYAATRTIEQIIYSAPYQNRLATAKFKSYEHWTGLATKQRTDLAEIVGRAVVDGLNPREVRSQIAASLEVTEGKAKQYAQTDITDTLRLAKLAETEHTQNEMGIKTGLLWASALKPTTRPWHASRHGKVYTPAQVKAFYAERGNRYNCYCSVTECLLDASGKPILTDTLKKRMAGALEKWHKDNPEK